MTKELLKASEWLNTCDQVVLAIVLRTWGSAPRRAGSIMVVHPDSTFEGSVSGGCVEGSVIAEALALIESQKTVKTLTFSVTSEQAWEVGLACGGEIEIRLFRLKRTHVSMLEHTLTAISERRPVILSIEETSPRSLSLNVTDAATDFTAPSMKGDILQIPFQPSLRLEIVGAVHIAQHLATMAKECGFSVRIVDPREAFTENRDFAGVIPVAEWPDDYFEQNPPDSATAVVTLTHDPKLDDAALVKVLPSDTFYIGCLGGRKTHDSRLQRLASAGMNKADLARIHGPVGLSIGAANPSEIAVSIMADIIKAARLKS